MTSIHSVCTHCAIELEFDEKFAGQEISCPGCQGRMSVPNLAKKNPSLIGKLFAGLKGLGQHSKIHQAKKSAEFERIVKEALSDGVLTDEEMLDVFERYAEFGITTEDIGSWNKEMFEETVSATLKQNDCLTPAQVNNLKEIQVCLRLDDDKVVEVWKRVERGSFMSGLREGNLPPVDVPNIVLKKGEQAYWSEPATYCEDRVVSRKHQGGSRGVSIRLMKGVSFRVGARTGHSVSETAPVPVGIGDFIITNLRLIFQGDPKSFSVALDKIFEMQPSADRLTFSETGRDKSRVIIFDQPNGDLVCGVLNHVLKQE